MLKNISPSRGPRRNKDTGDAGKSTCKFVIKLKIDKALAILSWPRTRTYIPIIIVLKIIMELKIDLVLAILPWPHTRINTYHHRLKENPSPTPLVHDPPTQKIGWNLKAQVWICLSKLLEPENKRQPQRQSWWRSPGVSSHWGLQSSSSIHYTPRIRK